MDEQKQGLLFKLSQHWGEGGGETNAEEAMDFRATLGRISRSAGMGTTR